MDSERWPDAQGSHGPAASFHFDQLPRFPIALHQYYVWSKNRTFLHALYPQLQSVMTFLLLKMNGSSGIPINDGTPENNRPSTCGDQVKSGWKDA